MSEFETKLIEKLEGIRRHLSNIEACAFWAAIFIGCIWFHGCK